MKRVISIMLSLFLLLFPALSIASDYSSMTDEELQIELEKIQTEIEKRGLNPAENKDTDDKIIFETVAVTLALDSLEVEYNELLDKYTLYVTATAENRSQKPLIIIYESLSINGLESRCSWGFETGAEKKTRDRMILYDPDKKYDIKSADDIKSIEFNCSLANEKYFTVANKLGIGKVIHLK